MKIAIADLKFDAQGLVPAIISDANTRQVLTLAYMNAESLQRTLDTSETWFWSRSRSCLWHKGETSGHTQRVVDIAVDCDLDAIRILVVPAGPACHTGAQSCFHNELQGAPGSSFPGLGVVLSDLFALVEARKLERPAGSYTSYLFDRGLDKILKKIGEESAETIIAAKNEDPNALIGEASDLLYHLIVLLVERGLSLEQVGDELISRVARRTAR
jgi:phosphoribosyl-AMP cyclohydrolase / phosphoribosyl-ATP pyrophosphohydrolase